MSVLLERLQERFEGHKAPLLIAGGHSLSFSDIAAAQPQALDDVRPGDVVALIGDFEPRAIQTLLRLFDLGAVVVPLTEDTRADHAYFFEAAGVDLVLDGSGARALRGKHLSHPLLDRLRQAGHAGLVLFSSGTTGRPKAILHDFETFIARFLTPRPALKTLNFLLFDHIGGINTLFHTLFNRGTTVIPGGRSPETVFRDIALHGVELLPTTPTFLRLALMSGLLETGIPPSLRMVTYGTEAMDQTTLKRLCALMPRVEFRQTYGMSELGILRIKSRARDSLWMKVAGEGVETKVVEGSLRIRAKNRMLGYLNAPSPFDPEGWYDTMDLVESDGDWLRIVGRASNVISVGGLKVLPEEIERAALAHPAVLHARAEGKPNPLTGQHVELTCEAAPEAALDRRALREHLKNCLPEALIPHRIRLGPVAIGHRFKRA